MRWTEIEKTEESPSHLVYTIDYGETITVTLVIVLIVFGAGKLPEVGTAVGKAIHAFKKAQTDNEQNNSPGLDTRKTNG